MGVVEIRGLSLTPSFHESITRIELFSNHVPVILNIVRQFVFLD